MELFEASSFDITELSQLFNDYRVFYNQPSDVDACRKFIAKRIQDHDSIIYVVRNETEIFGFAQLYPLFSSVQMKRLWVLNDLFVKQSARRKGIARMLIERCRELAVETDASGLLLETEKNNMEGNKLYPAENFILLDNSNFYFWNTSLSE